MKASTHRTILRIAAPLAVVLFCSLTGRLTAGEDEPLSTTTERFDDAAGHDANAGARIGARFTDFAGSADYATALVTGLHSGTTVTLTSTVDGVATTAEFTPATGQLGYGNTFISLALAQESLAKAGITRPTPAQIVAALNGGTVTGSNGTAIALTGVLTLRAAGQGWGDIAQALDVKLGRVLHNLHAAHHHLDKPAPPTAATKTERIAGKFADFAGSDENAKALVTGLHDGTAVTLTATVDGVASTTAFTPATGKLGYGSTALSLSLAEKSLVKAGITQPTPAQIVTALNGGTVTGANGAAVNLAGVLTLRAAGQGWGAIARTLDVKLGWGLHGLYAKNPHVGKPMPPTAANNPGRLAGSFDRSPKRPENIQRPAWTNRPNLPNLSQIPHAGKH